MKSGNPLLRIGLLLLLLLFAATVGSVGAQVSNGLGWVWANDPTAAAYTPHPFYQYNSTGADNTITRIEAGLYQVEFIGLEAAGIIANAHVSSYGTDVRCGLDSMAMSGRDYHVLVRCFAPDGTQTDYRFTALLFIESHTDGALNNAFLGNGEPLPSDGYEPAWQFHSKGGRSVVTRTGVGNYFVRIEDTDVVGGTVMVNAIGNVNRSCQVEGWGMVGLSDGAVFVRCFGPGGVPVYAPFHVTYAYDLHLGHVPGLPKFEHAFAWANEPSAVGTYEPSATYRSNLAGGAITITRTGPGAYEVVVPGARPHTKSGAFATAYGSVPGTCSPTLWADNGTGTTIRVGCVDPAGVPTDLRFTVQYLTDAPVDPTWAGCTTVGEIPRSECEALDDLFAATGGDGWTNRTGWRETNTPCSWNGISCTENHVTGISLGENNLTGSLPAGLDRLGMLRSFDVWNNHLTGGLPEALGSVTSLEGLEFSINGFNGPLPESYGALSNLSFFSIWSNQVSGPIPGSWAGLSSLNHFQVGTNQLTGLVPAFFGSLASLQFLYLSDNQFSGPIPPELGNGALVELALGSNELGGSIPATLGGISTLTRLELADNLFAGIVPLAVAQRCAAMAAGRCVLAPNPVALCIPDQPDYAAIGVNPIGGLFLSASCGNRAPVAVNDAYTIPFNTGINLPVLANDSDPDGDALTVTAIAGAAGHGTATVVAPGQMARYEPTAGYSGPDSFQYTVSDGQGATATATVSLTVLPQANRPPVAVDDAATTAFNTAVDILVRANDSDPDGDAITLSAIPQLPAHGIAAITAGGASVRYTPTTGYSGPDAFRYTISDGRGATASANVTVTVGAQTGVEGQVTFVVDMNREIRLGNLRSGRVVGLMGSVMPLTWDVMTSMTDANSDGIYEVVVPFTLALGTQVQYKFVFGPPAALIFEDTVGPGEFGNRVMVYGGTTTLASVAWNNVEGTAAEEIAEIPTEFSLSSVYPNPFNPTARVAFEMASDASVRIDLTDTQGRLVRTLVDGMRTAGRHEVSLEAADLPSGVYLVTMRTGTMRASRTVTLVK